MATFDNFENRGKEPGGVDDIQLFEEAPENNLDFLRVGLHFVEHLRVRGGGLLACW